MRTRQRRRLPREADDEARDRGERGAVLVHVAVALMGLLAFSALSIDLGVLWVARTQAQNAADAAALSGAVSLAYANPTDLVMAADAGRVVAEANTVLGDAPTGLTLDVATAACPAGAPETPGQCVRSTITRGAGGGPALPAYFSQLFGVNAQEVRASAYAKVLLGNATNCLRPFAVPDSWIETSGPWTGTSLFERYEETTPGIAGPLLPNPDVYVAPSPTAAGSSYTLAHVGEQVLIDPANYHDQPLVGQRYFQLDLPRGSGDIEVDFLQNITSCHGQTVSIGDTVMTDLNIHPTNAADGIQALVDSDPGAYWDGSQVQGSAFAVSPRIIAIVLFDPDLYKLENRRVQRVPVVVRSVIGLFIRQAAARSLDGYIVPLAGNYDDAAPALTETASFLRAVALVR